MVSTATLTATSNDAALAAETGIPMLFNVLTGRWPHICSESVRRPTILGNFATFAVLIAACCTCAVSAQTPAEATVTFYTHGSFATTGLPGSKHGIFFGAILDQNKLLVVFHEGFVIKNNRFITLRLPAGNHEFIASNSKKPKNENHIAVTLEPGKQYFFRAQNESSGVVVVESEKARLDQVSCQEAHAEADDARPLNPKHPPTSLPAMRINSERMPQCQ